MFLTFKLVLLLFPLIVECNLDYCLSDDDNPYLMFARKTPYDPIRGSGGSETTCKSIQMWLISRHGTRRAEKEERALMKGTINIHRGFLTNLRAGLLPRFGGLCVKDIVALRGWMWNETAQSQTGILTDQGQKELYALAKRYQMRYPHLLTPTYNPKDFYFKHTNTQRTNKSCRAFVDGIFGDNFNTRTNIICEDVDHVLLPQLSCQYWLENIQSSPVNSIQAEAFKKTPEFQSMLLSISKKLGFRTLLGPTDIQGIYDNCRFDKSEYLNHVSPWCAVFTKRQLCLMEYLEDLIHYYAFSYGHEFNKHLGCMTLKHLMETFEKTILNGGVVNGPKVVANFAHDTTIDMMLTAMGYGEDQRTLSGTNYEDFLVNRKYKGSVNTPFCANLAAVLHDCGKNVTDRFKIQFFLNEKQMLLPGCDRGLCGWEFLRRLFPDYKKCSLDVCDMPDAHDEYLY